MFPADRRPTLLYPYSDNQFNGHNVVCDRLIVGFVIFVIIIIIIIYYYYY